MANSLTAVMPKILARGLLALREQAVMPRLVNADYSNDAARKGDTIDVPLPSAVAATDVSPSNTAPVPADTAPTVVQIPLNHWKKAGFHLTDREVLEIDAEESFVPMQMSEAVRALANTVNASVHAEYAGVYGFVGSAGVTPFGGGVGDATAARKLLNKQLAPRADRRGVLDFDAEANALALPQFSDAEKIGSAGVKIEGEIGRKFGIDWVADDGVPTHVAGTAADTGSYTVSTAAAASAGAAAVQIRTDTGTPTLVAGDVISFAGHDQTYVVTAGAGLTVGGVAVAIAPALRADVADAAAVNVRASHVVNLAFHRDAFALAMRPLSAGMADLALGNRILAMTDAQTGLSLRLEVSRQYKQTVWEFDVLWGVKLVRPELAVRIAG
ncbi:MAG: P22 phage major capsid protein family protein [Thalassobaculum sp.]|uniref:P22 phage major capsid protein family protein n=1 Tax=Thalassobaculum sp. TaxID=2022740 RepID=UPI0032EFC25C